MTTSDVHVPAFEPTPTSVTTRATAPGPYYHHPCFQSTASTTTMLLNSTDPTLYSLNHHHTSSHVNHYPPQLVAPPPPPPQQQQQQQQQQQFYSHPPYASSTALDSVMSSASSSASNATFSVASVGTSATTITPSASEDERPCEKYQQFLHSSRQERIGVIDKLVEVSADIIDSIWNPAKDCKVVSTRNFIHEILKRSKATYSTLQISLFYLFRVKKRVHERLQARQRIMPPSPPLTPPSSQEHSSGSCPARGAKKQKDRMDDMMLCGRRMFLASLMVASKYLHDKNYRNRAWAKIAGLELSEVNTAELAFLRLIDYKLHISKPTFDKWYTLLHGYLQKKQLQQSSSSSSSLQIKMDSV